MKANVTIRKLLLFYKVIIIAWMVSGASIISITANAQSPKAQHLIRQLNDLARKSKCITKVTKRYTVSEGVLYTQSKGGERFGYDLRLVQHVRIQKGHDEMPFYKNTYEVFLEFDYAVSNYIPIWGILKEQDALKFKKVLEQLVAQVKVESID